MLGMAVRLPADTGNVVVIATTSFPVVLLLTTPRTVGCDDVSTWLDVVLYISIELGTICDTTGVTSIGDGM